MSFVRTITLALFVLSLPGCALLKLDTELNELSNAVAMLGEITSDAPVTGPITLMALHQRDGQAAMADYQTLAKPGPFAMVLPRDRYILAAFEDVNGNQAYDPGEPVAWTAEGILPSTAVEENIVLRLSSRQTLPEDLPGDPKTSAIPPKQFKPDLGAIADLENPLFSAAYGQIGLWQPMTFINEVRGGVFLLEKYDPAKIPILFVHGIGGSPQDWRYFFDHLDRKRYQPWFYYYASGLPLEDSAYWLNRSVEALHEKFGFQRLYVTAHSMGSLVARRFIDLNVHDNPQSYIKLFISLSAPWGGVESAESGVRNLSTPIPCWSDIVPESKFLKAIYETQLPRDVPYFLLFSYRGGSLWDGENSDGAISLSSQLDPRAQKTASRIVGIDEDHNSILRVAGTFEIYREILSLADRSESQPAPVDIPKL